MSGNGKARVGEGITRREFVAALLALWAGSALPGISWAQAEPAGADDLDAFLRLSAFVTGVAALDRETARQILDLIRAEPWGKEHLGQIAAKLLPSGPEAGLSGARGELLDPRRFTDGERWFIGHLLTTWFTGVYYHQIGNHVVAYREALMHVALQDVRPAPGHCGGEFGYWSEPPALEKLK